MSADSPAVNLSRKTICRSHPSILLPHFLLIKELRSLSRRCARPHPLRSPAPLHQTHEENMTAIKSISEATLSAAHKAYAEAEKLWEEALEARFGKNAGDARYDHRGKGEEGSALRRLYDAYMAANRAWHALRDPLYAHTPQAKD
jgi:hypothetical protein